MPQQIGACYLLQGGACHCRWGAEECMPLHPLLWHAPHCPQLAAQIQAWLPKCSWYGGPPTLFFCLACHQVHRPLGVSCMKLTGGMN